MQSWVRIEYIVIAALLIVATIVGLLTRGATADHGICLEEPLQFADGDVKGCLSAPEAKRLLDRQLAMGENRNKDGVALTHPKDMNKHRQVTTCRQYDEATAQGWYALTTYDMSMESFFSKTCALIDALAKAAPARRSFIKEPRVGIGDLDIVGAAVLKGFVPTGEADATVGTLVRAGSVAIEKREANVVQLSSNGFIAQLEEVARADFNGDGTEDIFVFSAVYAQGGTLRGYETRILSRMSATTPLTIVN
jgi:hypothetical protein